MKTRLCIFLSFLLCIALISCDDKSSDDPRTDGGTDENTLAGNQYVNNWILDSMATYYLWNDHLPERATLDFTADPYDFFDGLLSYEYSLHNNSFVFSRMEGTHINVSKATTGSSDLGFEYVPINFVNASGASVYYINLITYVKKGTNAEKQGLRRGYLINAVDDVSISSSNWYSSLYNNQSSYKIRYATNLNNQSSGIYVTKQIDVTTNYVDTPIYMDSVYTVGARKIGYIVYNSYEAGDESTLPYDVELSQILTNFKSQGVRDLVVDLRYNGGGLVRSAKFLASALVPSRDIKNIFEVKTYNDDIQSQLDKLSDNSAIKISWMYEYFTDNITNSNNKVLASIPRLGDQLDNICFITTGYTASASEMTINTLKPYMQDAGRNLYIVGETTVGKNVGSWAIYEDNNANNTYVLWPITFQSHNKLYPSTESSNYASGFTPDVKADDFDMLYDDGLRDLGDTDETLLQTAISKITGQSISSTITKTTSTNYILKGKSSLDRKHKTTGGMYIDKDDLKDININSLKSSKAK